MTAFTCNSGGAVTTRKTLTYNPDGTLASVAEVTI